MTPSFWEPLPVIVVSPEPAPAFPVLEPFAFWSTMTISPTLLEMVVVFGGAVVGVVVVPSVPEAGADVLLGSDVEPVVLPSAAVTVACAPAGAAPRTSATEAAAANSRAPTALLAG